MKNALKEVESRRAGEPEGGFFCLPVFRYTPGIKTCGVCAD